MDDLVTQLISQLGSDGLSQISKTVGADDSAASSALTAALPMLVSALANNVSEPEGAESLFNALEKDHDGSILSDLGGLLADPAAAQGGAILGHVLGDKQSGVTKVISEKTGLSAAQVSQILEIGAPMVMGALGKQKQEEGLDLEGLTSLLGGQSQASSSGGAGDLLSMLNTALDADKDGSAVDEVVGLVGKLFKKK